MKLYCSLLLLSISLFSVQGAANESVPLSSLKALSLNYSKVEKLSGFEGRDLLAEVAFPHGQDYQFRLPFTIQRLDYQVKDGTFVTKGQKIALLQGREVHHYLDEYDAAQAMFAMAEKQFKDSDRYRKDGVVMPESWYGIGERYYAAKLKVEHFAHTAQVLKVEGEDIYLLAPQDGIVLYRDEAGMDNLGTETHFASLLPASALRLSARLSDSQRRDLLQMKVSDACSLPVAYADDRSGGYWRNVWSQPLTPSCTLTVGQRIHFTPVYGGEFLSVPKSALFQLDNKHYVAVKESDSLLISEVQVLSSKGDRVFIEYQDVLDGAEVLSRSVSAVQGIMMELGGE